MCNYTSTLNGTSSAAPNTSGVVALIAAGYSFNTLYGFGRPDAGAAVELARAGSVSLPALIETDWLFADIEPIEVPDNR